jgi:hypothetical protein
LSAEPKGPWCESVTTAELAIAIAGTTIVLDGAAVVSRGMISGWSGTGGLNVEEVGALFGGDGDLRDRFKGCGTSELEGGRGEEKSWGMAIPASPPDRIPVDDSPDGV